MSKSRKPAPVTTDEQALLAAVWASPHDDLPRLVYADYLEEHGRPERAEFIRLQIDKAVKEAAGEDITDEAWQREEELIDQYGADWFNREAGTPVTRDQYDPVNLYRGFASFHRRYTASEAARIGAGRVPRGLTELTLCWSGPDKTARILAAPVVRAAAKLTLEPKHNWTDADFAALATARDSLNHVTHLRVVGPTDRADLDWLETALPDRVHSFTPGTVALGEAFLERLSASPAAGRLTALDLRCVQTTDADLLWFGATAAFPRLRTVWLEHRWLSPDALIEFVSSPVMSGLHTFHAPGVMVLEYEVWHKESYYAALAASPAAAGLRTLHLDDSMENISPSCLTTLAHSRHLARVRAVYASTTYGPTRAIKAAFGDRLRPIKVWRNIEPDSTEV